MSRVECVPSTDSQKKTLCLILLFEYMHVLGIVVFTCYFLRLLYVCLVFCVQSKGKVLCYSQTIRNLYLYAGRSDHLNHLAKSTAAATAVLPSSLVLLLFCLLQCYQDHAMPARNTPLSLSGFKLPGDLLGARSKAYRFDLLFEPHPRDQALRLVYSGRARLKKQSTALHAQAPVYACTYRHTCTCMYINTHTHSLSLYLSLSHTHTRTHTEDVNWNGRNRSTGVEVTNEKMGQAESLNLFHQSIDWFETVQQYLLCYAVPNFLHRSIIQGEGNTKESRRNSQKTITCS